MKSKKMLAQIAAFSLVFGMTGVVSSWADNTANEVVVNGTTVEQYDPIKCVKVDNTLVDKAADGSLSITGKDVRGVWLKDGATLTANNVNFNDKGTANEVGLDSSSKLIMKGGSIKVPGVAFTADGGSTATTDGTTIETGVLARNSTIILKNSTTTGVALYAGNEFGQGKVEEGLPVGTLTIDGGKANVKNALVQNKGSMTVTNGAVLDLTGDLSATDEDTQAATGIKKGGEIVVRAWGPDTNTVQVEKENSDTINKLDKATSFTVNGKSTIKADTIDVTGDSYQKHTARAKLMVSESSTVTANTMNVGKYGYTYFKDSQLTVNGKLSVSGAADGPTNPNPVGVEMHGGSATLNEVNVKNKGNIDLDQTNITAKQLTMDSSSAKINGGSLSTDDINLTNNVHFCAYRGAKLDVKSLTADDSSIYVGRSDDNSDDEVSPAEVNVQQMALKNGSELILAAGTVNADQITMDKSDIDIAGVGTLIANKMTLNNTTLSLSGIQNEAATLALDADEDIQPLDVRQNGVTVEVKDTLTMNGGTLQVNDGSKLITNQMKLANDSTVTVDGTNSSYAIKGTDNTVSGDAKIAAINGGSVTLAEGAGIRAEAGTDNKVKTIITADSSSTVDVTKGSLYIAHAKRDGTVYDVSTAIIKNGTENKGNEFKHIYGDSLLTKAVEKDENGNYTFVSNIAEISKGSLFSHILEEADENGGKLKEFMDNKAFKPSREGMTDAEVLEQGHNALEHAAAIAEMAGVTHGTYGFAQDFSGMIADHKGEGSGIWANYLRQDKKVDGFQVAGRKAKYDVKYNGFLIGSDLISDENSRTGIAFAYADGSHTEKDGVTGKNDTKYYGGDVYHHFTAGGIQYKADIGFIKSDNDLEQTQLGTTIKGSVDGNAFFAGIRAEKEIALGASSLTPYAGLRYYRIHTGDFTDSLGMKHETENANLWNLPVGVEFRHEVKNGNWSLTPVVEIGYNFAMGDKDTKETVSLGDAADTFAFDIGESAFLARLGVEAENSTWTLGGGYRYQKGSDTQSNQWYIQAGYRF